MIVVSDTTPLIALMKASHLELLQKLFGKILLPQAVFDELTSNVKFQEEAKIIKSCEFLQVVASPDKKTVDILRRATGLDLGESEAIVYAENSKADILLMDERKGRNVAAAMGLPIMGSIGVLTEAHASGLLTAADFRASLEKMQDAGIRLSERLLQTVLNDLKDQP